MGYIYAGAAPFTGEGRSKSTGGLFRRRFEADGWEKLTAGLPQDAQVRCVEVDPNCAATVYAGGPDGLYRSDDSGDSWRRLPLAMEDPVVWTVLIDPTDSKRIYVGTAPQGVYCSRDGGENFQKLAMPDPSGLIDMGFPCRVIRMALDAANSAILYVGVEVGGVIRSQDGGDSWSDCCAGLLMLAEQTHLKNRILSQNDAEGMLDIHALATSTACPNGVFLATRMGLFESTDQGRGWREMGIGGFSPLTYVRDVMVSPHDPKTLFATCSDEALGRAGALYRSRDLGKSWQRFDHGIEITSTLMKVAVSHASPERVICAARKGQVLGTDDNGTTWRDLSLPAGVADVYTVVST